MEHLSLYRGSIRGVGGGSFTAYSKTHAKEGSGNEASLSLYRLHEGNLEGGLLH
jgi:hypothetical protein